MAIKIRSKVFRKPFHWSEERYNKHLKENGLFRTREELENSLKKTPEKFILDACCGGRQIWFQKEQKNTIFLDIREVEKGVIKLQPNFCIKPNIIGDYRDLPFPDKSFKLVVWDIPHIMGKKISGIIQTKYGYLDKDNYKEDLKKGFDEIWRILDDYGVLEFKYADINLPIREILSIFPQQPLFGTVTKKGVNNTFWVCFMKIPESQEQLIATPLNSKGSQEANSLNISLKESSNEDSQISSNDETSLNHDIQSVRFAHQI